MGVKRTLGEVLTARGRYAEADSILRDVLAIERGMLPKQHIDLGRTLFAYGKLHLAMGDARVQRARERLFGSWEMNWIAYNDAHDVTLPGSKRGSLPYFMYPQAEIASSRIDPLDPDNFRYRITVKEVD